MVTDNHSPFPGKDVEEHFVFFFRQHWVRLVPRLARIVLQTLVIIGVAWISFVAVGLDNESTDHVLGIILLFAFLITQFELLIVIYRYFMRITIFTDRKVHRIKKTLLLIDEHQSIDLWVLQDIRKNQHGMFQRLLGYGTLVLDAQDTQVRLHFVPQVQKKADILLQLRERAREHMAWGRERKPTQHHGQA